MRKRFQFSLATLLAANFLFGLWFGLQPSIRKFNAIRRLSNTDVSVDGGFFGLDVRISGKSATYLKSLGVESNPWLQTALKDEKKFAAAHVLLVEINLPQQSFDASQWNQLRIDLLADGSTEFHPSQIPKLIEYWQQVIKR